MKPLTLEETALKEEMKERCLAKGQYKDEKAKDKFDMLCHLEDFEVQYYNLQEVIKEAREYIETPRALDNSLAYVTIKSHLLEILSKGENK